MLQYLKSDGFFGFFRGFNYTKRTKQRIQTDEKKFLWEAVINLNEEHTINDVRVLARIIRMIYGWQAAQIGVHRDEGFKDPKSGKNIYNYHAHIIFFMLDKEGIYRFKKRDFGIKKMEELQTLVSYVLKMERGKSKKITKIERLEHRQYKQQKQYENDGKTKYDILQQKMDMSLMQMSRLRKNKKKTVSKMRILVKRIKHDDEGREKLRLFCSDSLDSLFKDPIKYPLLYSNNILDNDFIFEWAKEAQKEILFLRTENTMLRDVCSDFDGKFHQELEYEGNEIPNLHYNHEEDDNIAHKSQLSEVKDENVLQADKDFENACLSDLQSDSNGVHVSHDITRLSKFNEPEMDEEGSSDINIDDGYVEMYNFYHDAGVDGSRDDELCTEYEIWDYQDRDAEETALNYILSQYSDNEAEYTPEDNVKVLEETGFESEKKHDTDSISGIETDDRIMSCITLSFGDFGDDAVTISKIELESDSMIESDFPSDNNENDSTNKKDAVEKIKAGR